MRLKIVMAAALLALPAAAAVGSAAFADPSGCSAAITGFGLTSASKLYANGEGRCSTSANRNLQIEIKQDLSLQPDPVALHSNDTGSKTYYAANPSGCDNGNNASYYGRAFFTTNTTYHDTSAHKYSVC
ncbi:hypothetical protein [Actinoplanes sp. N902-109]|uniref:hypothetical protein n=1 Tax=Actinoplanes sp. (strain N902-109) TaxID=649831 RepID=UPI0003293C28|nr:hypothetical protein [Actinoplanes sp. N902-109]AGL17182.1 hypothetical protein L083_3672 [Actinoplanes sp. N902-109]